MFLSNNSVGHEHRFLTRMHISQLMCFAILLITVAFASVEAAPKVGLTYSRQFNLGFSVSNYENEPIWIAVGSAKAGIIVAYDPNAYKMRVYNTYGKQLRSFGAIGMLPGQFTHPFGMSIDDDGMIYVADRKVPVIRVYDQYGKFIAEYKPIQGVLGWSDVAVTNDAIIASPESFSAFANEYGIYLYKTKTKKSYKLCSSCYGPVTMGASGNIIAVYTTLKAMRY